MIFLSLFLLNCQRNKVVNSHGIMYLENRQELLKINESNKNDVKKDIIIDYMLLFLREMWVLCLEMAPYLLLGMLVSGLISIFIDSSFIFKHIGQKNAGSVLKSTLFQNYTNILKNT